MSSPEKKKRSLVQKPSILSIPDDLLLNCFARVSRLYHPTLSLVSKRFRSVLASPELYQTRSLLGRTESFLYVCLQFHPNLKPCWFTLCRKPNRTLTNATTKYALARIPNPCSPETHQASFVSVGCNIYAIGGAISSSNVSILDCRSHTWHEAPSMRVKRLFPVPNVFDGKIYVAGGSASSNLMEVFDPKSQTWEHVLNPFVERWEGCICVLESAVIDGEIYMFGYQNECMTYKPKEDRWEAVEQHHLNLVRSWFSYCVIENILYCYCYPDEIKWYDSEMRYWRNLIGMNSLPKFYYNLAKPKLVDYGGKMAVFWDKNVASSSGYKNIVICCAVIALERLNDEEISGKLEWSEELFEVSCRSYNFLHALVATL